MRGMTVVVAILCACALAPVAALYGGDAARSDFFNGKDLEGWEGLNEYWSVQDGALVGTAPAEGLKFNTFLCSK
ncbi:MAG TPA: hypothetical protein VGY58_20115, partial [Gemmataceae bacterium]|nr:hypothetical protein [Gemmataceae bacterium]